MKRSDFQKGQLPSVTAADKIVVLDEDGTDEPQVVDFAAVAASAPFTDAFWPYSTTSLGFASITNADKIPIIDGTTPYFTPVNELAQASQFSSRYVSKADEEYRFVSAPSMAATAGSPALSAIGGGGSHLNAIAWLMDSTNAECVAFTEILPDYWTTFHLDVYWANNAASSGGVGINVRGGFAGDTEVPDGNTFNATLAVAAPTTVGTMKVSRLLTGQTNNTGKPLFLRVCRVPADPGDDLANDAAYYGVLLTRAS